jgi:hypothetical protein
VNITSIPATDDVAGLAARLADLLEQETYEPQDQEVEALGRLCRALHNRLG